MKPLPVSYILFLFSLLFSSHISLGLGSDDQKSVYIVHMDKSQMPLAFSTHHHWYSSLLTSTLPQTPPPSLHHNLIYVYDHAFHGFSALMSERQLQTLKTSLGFISAYPDNFVIEPDTTRSVDFLGLSTVSGLWPAAELGKDVIIGVIDSGIWPESKSFRDTGMGNNIPSGWKGICQEGEEFNSSLCNKKVIGARYFSRGFQALHPNVRLCPNSARDIDGHGTHVASTAAGNFVTGASFLGYANGTIRGAAPRARLAIYKVLWNDGGNSGADFLAGIDQAVADGVHILSVSLTAGSNGINLYENPLSIASFGAREKGVVVVFSGGNRGPSVRSIREKGIPWGIVVAAGTVDRWFAGTLTLGNGKSITGWSFYRKYDVSIKNVFVVYDKRLASCDESVHGQLNQSVIVVCNMSLSGADFGSMIKTHLPRSGALGAIIIGEDPEIFVYTSFTYPATVITQAQGREVIDYVYNTAAPRASINFHETIIGQEGPKPAPSLAYFSSRGPAMNYPEILKPDILAPGALILAAYTGYTSNPGATPSTYGLMWGTSMACPHISGVAALLKASHPDWSPSAIQSAMMTTANPLNNANQPIQDYDSTVASPLGIGSGQVDPNLALNPGLVYDNSPQDFVNLICALNFTAEQTRAIIRSSYNCSTPSADLNHPSFIATFHPQDEGRRVIKRYQRTVTNVGDGAATYTVRVEAPTNATVTVMPQRLVFEKKYEKQSYWVHVTFVADLEIPHRGGSITWTDMSGKYNVRSPIMVSSGPDFVKQEICSDPRFKASV